jgi:hypothetical protein
MGPGMGCDLMTGLVSTLERFLDLGFIDTAVIITVHKEGHLDILLVEKIKKLRCPL